MWRALKRILSRRDTLRVDASRYFMSDTPFISPADLARRWNLSTECIRRSIRSGKLAAMKLPGARQWQVSMLAVRSIEQPFNRSQIHTLDQE